MFLQPDSALKDFLEEKYERYNRPDFIESDPISIPHKFSKKQDIEIAAFLSATLAWGQRPVIIKNAKDLMRRMDFSPHDFILNHTKKDLALFRNFKHRTFNETDCVFFLQSLQHIYRKYKSLEEAFAFHPSPLGEGQGVRSAIANFRKIFFSISYPRRTKKHVSCPPLGDGGNGSACKRINMFLRWMVRKDNRGVDFGIWNNNPLSPPLQRGISAADLMCPIDVHSGNVARKLGLLTRKQNDWQSVEELTNRLREFDSNDPVKYDFALFGLGVAQPPFIPRRGK